MLALRSPNEAYRRIDFDARVAGAGPAQLVALCYEQLISGLGTAIHADANRDNALKSRSLTRALSAVTALQLGVSGEAPVALALRRFYEATRRTLLDAATGFDAARLAALRQDYLEIAAATQASTPAGARQIG